MNHVAVPAHHVFSTTVSVLHYDNITTFNTTGLPKRRFF